MTDAPPKPRRRLALDFLRGLAVFLMIEQHVGIWVWEGPAPGMKQVDYPLLVGFNALGGMAAPLFVTLAGCGSAMFIAANRPKTDQTLVRRGLVLMGFGLALNLTMQGLGMVIDANDPGWFSWGSWFVLHMMGFAMALAPIWRRLSNTALFGVCAAVLVTTVVVRVWLDTPMAVGNAFMRDTSRPGGVLRLAFAESQFPVLPWLTFYLAGFASGRWLLEDKTGRVALLGLSFITLGGGGHALLKAGAFTKDSIYLYRAFELHLGFFPASVTIAGLLLGGALLLIAGVSAWENKRSMSGRNPMVTLGRISLTLLLLHVPLFRRISRLESIDIFRNLDANVSLAVVFVFFFLALVAAWFWERVNYRYGAEWLFRKLSGG